jgi:hypothetical protein
MKNLGKLFLALLFLPNVVLASWWFQQEEPLKLRPETCQSSREFIAVYQYLVKNINLAGSVSNAFEISQKVAEGCNGAALRFINTSNVLMKAELDNRTVIETALEMSQRTDSSSSAFFDIFQRSYLSQYLDLDIYQALKISKKLTTLFQGDVSYVAEDFIHIVDYCLSSKGLNLPKPNCAEIAARFSSYGEFHKKSLHQQFTDLSTFFTKMKKGVLSMDERIPAMDKILSVNEWGYENFKTGYEFAVSSEGLHLPARSAIQFGIKMALNSQRKPEIDKK